MYNWCIRGAAAEHTVGVVFAASSWLRPVVAALFSTRPNPVWLGHCLIDGAEKIALATRCKADLERVGAVRLRHEMYEPLPLFHENIAVPFCQGLERCDTSLDPYAPRRGVIELLTRGLHPCNTRTQRPM